jgi:hypothetical protein
MKSLALCTFTLLTAVAGVAHAGDDEKKQKLLDKIASYDYALIYFETEDGLKGAHRFKDDPAGCTQAIDELEAMGVAPTEVIYSRNQFPLRKAPAVCERYAKVKILSAAFEPITNARDGHNRISGMEPGGAGATMWSEDVAARGKACVDAINDVEAKGGAMDVVMRSTEPQMTATQTRTWCEDLAKRAAALAGDSTKADAAKKKAAHDRYAKHGAKGDKLEWLIYYDPEGKGFNWRVAGCKVTDDPKTLVKAKVLYQFWESDDGSMRVRKFSFKGHKLAKDQERTYRPTQNPRCF